MEELLYVPFEFENSGTRVIHYTRRRMKSGRAHIINWYEA